MKIRNGFVSNSSTTSFCIYGIELDISELEKFVDDDNDKYSAADLYMDMAANAGLVMYVDFECDNIYVGLGPESIGDHQTGGEFKADTQKRVKDLTGSEKKCEWMEGEISS